MIGDTTIPSAPRAVVDMAPERIHVVDVFDAGNRVLCGGVVWEDWPGAAFVHGYCAVGA